MSNFKIGEKAVFKMQSDVKLEFGVSLNDFNLPQQNEIVEIEAYHDDCHVFLKGYIFKKTKGMQAFHVRHLRKLDYAHTEKICAEIIESLKIEEVQLN